MKERGFSSTFILVPTERNPSWDPQRHHGLIPQSEAELIKNTKFNFFFVPLLTLNFFCPVISFVFWVLSTQGRACHTQVTLAGFYCLCLYWVTQAGGTGLLPWLGRPGPSWLGQQSQDFCVLWKNRMGLTPHLLARTADRAVRNLGHCMEKAELPFSAWAGEK